MSKRQRAEGGVPSDVLEGIFHWLPLKSLARFKLVHKEWNSSISNPGFLDSYQTRKFGGNHHHQLIFAQYLPRKTHIYTVESHSDPTNNNHGDQQELIALAPLNIPHQLMNNYDEYRIPPKVMGSYNGLIAMLVVLLNGDTDFILWNPLTNKHITSSFDQLCMKFCGSGDFCRDHNNDRMMSNSLFGLCYDYSSHAYAAVVVTRYMIPPPRPPSLANRMVALFCQKTDIHLVNFKTGEFTTLPFSALGKISFRQFIGGVGTVVCGVPHWMVELYPDDDMTSSTPKMEVLYFVLEEKSFKRMAGPTTSQLGKVMLGLGSLDGERQLSVVLEDTVTPSCFEVWVMKEYGNLETWTNLFVIQGDTSITQVTQPRHCMSVLGLMENKPRQCMSLLRLMENGEYLISVNGMELWGYDPEKSSLRRIQIEQCHGPAFSTIIANESSLISPSQGMW